MEGSQNHFIEQDVSTCKSMNNALGKVGIAKIHVMQMEDSNSDQRQSHKENQSYLDANIENTSRAGMISRQT